MKVFGPVPSRRLGRSLGINNIPPKICTYSCIYCQLGNTIKMEVERKRFFGTDEIFTQAKDKVREVLEKGEKIDYLTFVPDGEPTLDLDLREEIGLLKELGIRIALITNSSLLGDDDVRGALSLLDWVSVKVDAISFDIWKKVDRPHKILKLNEILKGIRKLRGNFSGIFTTETMLVRDVNDTPDEIEKIASFLKEISPDKAYISIPIRPPAEKWVLPPYEGTINQAFQIFTRHNINVEYLIGYEGSDFAYTGNPEEDILSITSVHPMREEGVAEFLKKAEKDWNFVDKLIEEGKLVKLTFEGKNFYMRRLKERR